MAQVMLRAPLSELCGGRLHAIAGATVGEVLVALEREHPPISGWGCSTSGDASASTSTCSSTASTGRSGRRSHPTTGSTCSPPSREAE